LKLAARIVVALFVALLVAAAGAWIYLHESLPRLDGEIGVKGLARGLKIVRDGEGVPHIFAQSERDGWFAVGYAHAQDRLWQMEFQRRVAQGRLAELFGERAYDTDRLMRTLGLARLAERIVERLDADTRSELEAYAAGVNAFLAADPVLPVEFFAFRINPEPWRPADSIGWLLVMAWDLSSNWRTELERLRFATTLGRERAAEILTKEALREALENLSYRERRVLELRYGLGGEHPCTLAEVGRAFNVTRERIRQIESKTMSKLRHPSRSQVLRDYLD